MFSFNNEIIWLGITITILCVISTLKSTYGNIHNNWSKILAIDSFFVIFLINLIVNNYDFTYLIEKENVADLLFPTQAIDKTKEDMVKLIQKLRRSMLGNIHRTK